MYINNIFQKQQIEYINNEKIYKSEIEELKNEIKTMNQVKTLLKDEAINDSLHITPEIHKIMEDAIKSNLDEISAKRNEEQLQEIANLQATIENIV